MDKASIIKDAITYIRNLQQEERRVQSEISELESGITNGDVNVNSQQQLRSSNAWSRSKKSKIASSSQYHSGGSSSRASPPLEDIEVKHLSFMSGPKNALFIHNSHN